jgi:F-type H+-transporting ATPase subunit delta
MITWQATNYAKVLFSLGIAEDIILKTKKTLENKELFDALDNPTIKEKEKEAVINSIFDKEICSYLKVLCKNQVFGMVKSIFDAYETLVLNDKNIIKAKLSFVTRPGDEEIELIKNMVCNKYKKAGVSLELIEDATLIGGYVLTVGDTEYDKSIKGTLLDMQRALARR